MLQRFIASILLVFGLAFNCAAEDARVASGITAADWLINGSNNNIEPSTYRTGAFSTDGTSSVTVNWTSHGKSATWKFSIADGSTVSGLSMNGAWVVATIPDANHFTFVHTGTASGSTSSTGTGVFTFGSAGLETLTKFEDGKMRFLCFFSHMSYDDPIKFPGTRGPTHLHTFFGNTLTNYLSTYTTLRATGLGTCDGGPINRTAYWFPSMIVGSVAKALFPARFQWYYQNPARQQLVNKTSLTCSQTGLLQDGRPLACPQLAIRRIQRGQRAIFGVDLAKVGGADFPDSYGGHGFVHWSCLYPQGGAGSAVASDYRYLHHRSSPSLGLTSAACPDNGEIQVRVGSPDCWDGTADNADHYSHFAYAGNDGNSDAAYCPASHPYKHMAFEVIATWYYSSFADVQTWYLSSDRFAGANYEAGYTWHWDMMFAWEDGAIDDDANDVIGFWSKWTLGMNPNPNDPTTYIYNNDANYVGGKGMRNFTNGGIGVTNIIPCTALGSAFTACALKDHSTLGVGHSDELIDIPAIPSANIGKARMR